MIIKSITESLRDFRDRLTGGGVSNAHAECCFKQDLSLNTVNQTVTFEGSEDLKRRSLRPETVFETVVHRLALQGFTNS